MDGYPLIKWIGFHTGPGVRIARACAFMAVVIAAPLSTHAFVGNLEGFPAPMGSVFLRWDDLTDGEIGFEIERKREGADFEAVTTTPPNAIHYTDTALTPGTRYTYRVRAVSTGQGLPWREVEVVTLPEWDGLPADPVLLGIQDGSVRFEFSGEGATYILEESPDLAAWNPVGETLPSRFL
jgi:hypothetical protein